MLLVIDGTSTNLRRRVGANAWVVLEELLLGATIDETASGQASTRATVRALAIRTGLSKDTVGRSLNKLRGANVVTTEALRHDNTGRFVSVRYVIDLATLPIVLRAVEPEPAPTVPARHRTSSAPQQLSMLA